MYKLMPFYCESLSCYICIVMVVGCCTSCVELEYMVFLTRITVMQGLFMGDLYWSSLANSLMDYDWCNLLKCNCFRRGVTVLRPGCYTLEVKLGTIDTSVRYKYSTIMGTRIVHPSLTHFKLLCSFYRLSNT